MSEGNSWDTVLATESQSEMTAEPQIDLSSVEQTIKELETTLNQNYSRAKKLMLLCRPNTSQLRDVSVKIDQL